MAEGKDDMLISLKDLEKEITCGICHEHYQEPKFLPCSHYFCKQCIVKLSRRAGAGNQINCPECRMKAILSCDNVDSLKTAFNVNRLKATYTKLLQAYEKDKKITAESISEEPGNAPKKCEVHDDFMILFCYDCQHFICRDCALTNHRNHRYEYNSKAALNKKKELLQSATHFSGIMDDFKKAVLKVNATIAEIEAQENSVAHYIETYFGELHTILEKKKEQLLQKNKDSADYRLRSLKAQEKQLSDACADLRVLIEATEQHLSRYSGNDILGMSSVLTKQISEKVQKYSFNSFPKKVFSSFNPKKVSSSFKLCPMEDTFSDVTFKSASEFETICNGLAQWVDRKISKGYITVNELKQTVSVGTKNSFTVQCKKQGKLDCRMSSSRSISAYESTRYDISRIGSCTYRVDFVAPEVPGQFKIYISVDGKDTIGSPYLVYVKSEKNRLGRQSYGF